jgi:hypothetical protein
MADRATDRDSPTPTRTCIELARKSPIAQIRDQDADAGRSVTGRNMVRQDTSNDMDSFRPGACSRFRLDVRPMPTPPETGRQPVFCHPLEGYFTSRGRSWRSVKHRVR